MNYKLDIHVLPSHVRNDSAQKMTMNALNSSSEYKFFSVKPRHSGPAKFPLAGVFFNLANV